MTRIEEQARLSCLDFFPGAYPSALGCVEINGVIFLSFLSVAIGTAPLLCITWT